MAWSWAVVAAAAWATLPGFARGAEDGAAIPRAAMTARAADGPLAWPEVTREARPWAYSHWLGSAVDESNMARELQRYKDGGLGGIHIVPIYGPRAVRASTSIARRSRT